MCTRPGWVKLDDTFEWDRLEIGDEPARPGQADHMARTPFAVTIVVTTMVTAVLVGSASAAAASAGVPSNRGWVTGSGHGDDDGDTSDRD